MPRAVGCSALSRLQCFAPRVPSLGIPLCCIQCVTVTPDILHDRPHDRCGVGAVTAHSCPGRPHLLFAADNCLEAAWGGFGNLHVDLGQGSRSCPPNFNDTHSPVSRCDSPASLHKTSSRCHSTDVRAHAIPTRMDAGVVLRPNASLLHRCVVRAAPVCLQCCQVLLVHTPPRLWTTCVLGQVGGTHPQQTCVYRSTLRPPVYQYDGHGSCSCKRRRRQ